MNEEKPSIMINSKYLALLFISIPVLALVYAYCIWYIPFIYLNFILTAFLGMSIGTLINKSLVLDELQYPKYKIYKGATSLMVCFLVIFCYWIIWVDLALNRGEFYGIEKLGFTTSTSNFDQIFLLTSNPRLLFNTIIEINKVGTWGLGEVACNGIFLSAIWIIEIALIIWFTLSEVFEKRGTTI